MEHAVAQLKAFKEVIEDRLQTCLAAREQIYWNVDNKAAELTNQFHRHEFMSFYLELRQFLTDKELDANFTEPSNLLQVYKMRMRGKEELNVVPAIRQLTDDKGFIDNVLARVDNEYNLQDDSIKHVVFACLKDFKPRYVIN